MRGAAGRAGRPVLLYTSRTLVRGREAADSLAIAPTVSAALSQAVRQALAAGPTWIIAKGRSPPTTSPCTAWASATRRSPANCSPA